MNIIPVLAIIIIALTVLTAVICKLFFKSKFDKFEDEFEKVNRHNFVKRYDCDAFQLTHHND